MTLTGPLRSGARLERVSDSDLVRVRNDKSVRHTFEYASGARVEGDLLRHARRADGRLLHLRATPDEDIGAVSTGGENPPADYEAAWCEARKEICEVSPDEPWCPEFTARCSLPRPRRKPAEALEANACTRKAVVAASPAPAPANQRCWWPRSGFSCCAFAARESARLR
jgi:hypothetical protein